MNDAHERAATAAETMAEALSASVQREQLWRERAEEARSAADAALERERAAAQDARDALVEASRAQAIATLAAALVRDMRTIAAVQIAREALFGAEGGPR